MDNAMKKVTNMTELFEKLSDLKAVFSYGQKIIPVLQSLIDFMRDTVPLLETVNNSIAESTRQIPKASHHISDVTSATELATTEILDIVDIISGEIGKLEDNLAAEKAKLENRKNVFEKIKAKLEPTDENKALVEEYESYNESLEAHEVISQILQNTKNNVFNITLSLQVQDITSQQLAAVNHLIENVQDKLASLILDLETSDFQNENIQESDDIKIIAPENSTFNPDAKYDKSTTNQDIADSLVNSAKASQDEIDKLFS